MQLGSIERVNRLSIDVIKHIRLAQEGSTGDSFMRFIKNFTLYSQQHSLNDNETIKNLLEVMASAYERKDILFVADILEYELMPLINALNSEEA